MSDYSPFPLGVPNRLLRTLVQPGPARQPRKRVERPIDTSPVPYPFPLGVPKRAADTFTNFGPRETPAEPGGWWDRQGETAQRLGELAPSAEGWWDRQGEVAQRGGQLAPPSAEGWWNQQGDIAQRLGERLKNISPTSPSATAPPSATPTSVPGRTGQGGWFGDIAKRAGAAREGVGKWLADPSYTLPGGSRVTLGADKVPVITGPRAGNQATPTYQSPRPDSLNQRMAAGGGAGGGGAPMPVAPPEQKQNFDPTEQQYQLARKMILAEGKSSLQDLARMSASMPSRYRPPAEATPFTTGTVNNLLGREYSAAGALQQREQGMARARLGWAGLLRSGVEGGTMRRIGRYGAGLRQESRGRILPMAAIANAQAAARRAELDLQARQSAARFGAGVAGQRRNIKETTGQKLRDLGIHKR